eukprot:13500618-Ditylum_brightwellii.AAC.1
MMKQTTDENKNGGLNTDSIMAQEEVEANFFCWDNSNNDKEELMKEVEQEAEQAKQNQDEKSSKRKTATGKEVASSTTPLKLSRTAVNVQSSNNSAIKTVAERIRERGESYIDNKSKNQNPSGSRAGTETGKHDV